MRGYVTETTASPRAGSVLGGLTGQPCLAGFDYRHQEEVCVLGAVALSISAVVVDASIPREQKVSSLTWHSAGLTPRVSSSLRTAMIDRLRQRVVINATEHVMVATVQT